ncbi:MAG: hypothetical protein HPY73_05705 [Methanomassiliicoccales archaeon]|nr:MAG: hypothetical protein HPY73_05705 [Methanomassiliicoccales archaeon]
MADDVPMERLRAQQSYEQMIIQGLMLSDKEASDQGLLAEFEDVIDSLWVSIPTDKKARIRVWTADMSKEEPCLLEWRKACEIMPPKDTPPSQMASHRKNKERGLRKKQILTDVLSKMKLLYKEPAVSRMTEEDDDGDGPL